MRDNKITRKGTQENKALLIKQEDGSEALKPESEVSLTHIRTTAGILYTY